MQIAKCRLISAVALALLAGCGSAETGPELVEVTGTVTMDGKPLENALVYFVPESGGMSSGMTDASGKFTLMYRGKTEGAVPGMSTVKVTKSDGEAGAELIPGVFNTASVIKRDVAKPGPNDFTIDLDKEKADARANRDRKPQA
ncbi:Bacterial Ig-like domain (group 1) [Caulifigura coniformis]|uniref:Bacterial Ig-like domain (Group 1) n=1 Tax=Caulifigura coniformis TaxID=2527983 RepID=A0A517SE15_9PLAN|nr:carboxypeptidase-like regulatory domain-containing protein [Caulifigura coniformis]QDT54369.1 Bacterial Ig-like domain (group 1) [Caulifigura coniformis]